MNKFLDRFFLGLQALIYIVILGLSVSVIVAVIWFLIDYPIVGWWVLGIAATIILIYLTGWVIEKGSEDDCFFRSNRKK